jgi:hypothetical protein
VEDPRGRRGAHGGWWGRGDPPPRWVTSHGAEQFTAGRNRVQDRWARPPDGPGGWTKALSIWVRKEDIREIEDDDQASEGVAWTPEPPDGFAAGIHIVVAKTDLGSVRVQGARPLGGFSLAGGEVALVLIGLAEVDEEQRQRLDEFRARALAMVPPEQVASAKAPRVSLFGFDDQGNRSFGIWRRSRRRSPVSHGPGLCDTGSVHTAL